MKKLLSLLLVIAMLALMVGCAADEVKNEEGSKPTESQTEAPKKAEFSRGTIEGKVYKNTYLGFQFTRPESWVYSTDEEIAAALNLGIEYMVEDEKFKDALEKTETVYTMMAKDTLTNTNISVGYENLAKTFSANITIDQYIAAFKQQLASLTQMQVEVPETTDQVTLGNCEFTRLVCDVTTYGVEMTQVYYMHKVDGYMVAIIVTIPDGYTVAQIEAMFQKA